MNEEQKKAAGQILSAVTDKNTVYRLGWGAIIALLAVAGIGDLISLIPLAGDVVAPIFWVVVAVYLYMKGFGLMNPGRLVTELVSMAAEMVPGIQEFPALLLGTALVIILTRLEDRTGVQFELPGRTVGGRTPLNQNGARAPIQTPAPLNIDGVRPPQKASEPEEEGELAA